MFTGLIEALGTVTAVRAIPSGRRVRIAAALDGGLAPGDSVAVNGVCLTAVQVGAGGFETEVSPETLRVTALAGLDAGAPVNLERPVRPADRLGGHLVQGHVDGIGRIAAVQPEDGFRRVTVRHPPALGRFIVTKGSIAVDGISLTVAACAAGRFDVQIIPYTWEHTTLHARGIDDPVNIECDIIGKYVARAVETAAGGRGGGA